MNTISPMAFVHPDAKLGENNEIGPFCYIDADVVIGDNNKLYSNVTIHQGARIGNNNEFFPGASISTKPQDLKYRDEATLCEVGDNNSIRENVTISRGTASRGKTTVGSNNLLMENMHVAHDCVLGSGLIIGNSTKLAGEVEIDDNAIISATVLSHQFCRIGGYVMIQGGWTVVDVIISMPSCLGKIGALGRILGPRGLMPNPKSGTVTMDVAKAVKEVKQGKIDFKVDKAGIVHASIGKVSFSPEKIYENAKEFIKTIIKLKPAAAKGTYLKSIFISSTMSMGIKVDPKSVE